MKNDGTGVNIFIYRCSKKFQNNNFRSFCRKRWKHSEDKFDVVPSSSGESATGQSSLSSLTTPTWPIYIDIDDDDDDDEDDDEQWIMTDDEWCIMNGEW